MHLHLNRGKRVARARPQVPKRSRCFDELVRDADVVIEGMRPGFLEQARARLRAPARSSTPRSWSARSPATARPAPTATCRATASRTTRGPGVARSPSSTTRASPHPDQANVGITAGPAFGALGDPRRARPARDDRRAAPTWRSPSPTPPRTSTGTASRPARPTSGPRRRSPATPATTTSGARPALGGHAGGRALPVLRVGRRPRAVHGVGAGVLEELLRGRRPHRTCSRSGRARSTPTTPAATLELQAELRDIFSDEHDRRSGSRSPTSTTRRSPRSNTPQTIADDPQFQDRLHVDPAGAARRRPAAVPAARRGRGAPVPTRRRRSASTPTRCSRDVLGYDDDQLAKLRATGALG